MPEGRAWAPKLTLLGLVSIVLLLLFNANKPSEQPGLSGEMQKSLDDLEAKLESDRVGIPSPDTSAPDSPSNSRRQRGRRARTPAPSDDEAEGPTQAPTKRQQQAKGNPGGGRSASSPAKNTPRQPAKGEKYLMLSSLPVGFASGLRTMLLPFLMLAATTNRTAVLPTVQFGIPAFRSIASDTSFRELSDFIDLDHLLESMHCVKVATMAQWQSATGGVVDTLLQIGLPTEKKAVADVKAPDLDTNCLSAFIKTVKEPPQQRKPAGPFWEGPWAFEGEVRHMHDVDGTVFKKGACASHYAALSAKRLLGTRLRGEQTIMIANFPGMMVGPFTHGGGPVKGSMKIFKDVPRGHLCRKPGDSRFWKSYYDWPELPKPWKAMAKTFAEEQLGDFVCVQIRGEKLVIKAENSGNLGTTVHELRPGNPYLERCLSGIKKIIRKEKGSRELFLLTDMDTTYGSPSARRSYGLNAWQASALESLRKAFPKATGFCGTDNHRQLQNKAKQAMVRDTLKAYPGNCANAEAAICRQASRIIRFGRGSMGDFVAGGTSDEETKWFKSCAEIIEAADSK